MNLIPWLALDLQPLRRGLAHHPQELAVEIRFGVEACVQHRLGHMCAARQQFGCMGNPPAIDHPADVFAPHAVDRRRQRFGRHSHSPRSPRQRKVGVKPQPLFLHQPFKCGDDGCIIFGGRARDVAALMAELTPDPACASAIDTTQITALGFSPGGTTVLAAGDVQFDPTAIGAYCDRFRDAASECVFMARCGVHPHALPPEIAADMTMSDLAHIIAVHPALGHALVPASLTDLPPCT